MDVAGKAGVVVLGLTAARLAPAGGDSADGGLGDGTGGLNGNGAVGGNGGTIKICNLAATPPCAVTLGSVGTTGTTDGGAGGAGGVNDASL